MRSPCEKCSWKEDCTQAVCKEWKDWFSSEWLAIQKAWEAMKRDI